MSIAHHKFFYIFSWCRFGFYSIFTTYIFAILSTCWIQVVRPYVAYTHLPIKHDVFLTFPIKIDFCWGVLHLRTQPNIYFVAFTLPYMPIQSKCVCIAWTACVSWILCRPAPSSGSGCFWIAPGAGDIRFRQAGELVPRVRQNSKSRLPLQTISKERKVPFSPSKNPKTEKRPHPLSKIPQK